MEFVVNGINWSIQLVEPDDKSLSIEENDYRFGTCNYKENVISIANDMCFSRTKAVLIHELTHAYIESTGQLTIAQFEQEHICEFMSFYAKPILDIADEFIELNLNV